MNPSSTMPPPTGTGCQILTFYSYKGGTGRSMALANIAWILASQGKRVLAIDWDLEAPGLHRYFAPFLADPELSETSGLIDFFAAFVEGSRSHSRRNDDSSGCGHPWFEDYADLLDFALSLDHEFPGDGTLDFVPAGRQGPSYGSLVSTFLWADFYEKLGGGVFLEAVKRNLREAYDYVLIDSRTGLSDTSGICTVQMPDDLVVFFTLNRQSMRGAAATAEAAMKLRQKPSGEPGLRVWPVASRIDLTEKERLEAVREMAHEGFSRSLWHLSRQQRTDYWARSEILYIPYYAYLETLSVAADRSGQVSSLLGCLEQVTGWITRGGVTRLGPLSTEERFKLNERFNGGFQEKSAPPAGSGACLYLSYCRDDLTSSEARNLFDTLRRRLPDCRIFWDDDTLLGSQVQAYLDEELKEADIVVVFFGRASASSKGVAQEIVSALRQKKVIVPVILADSVSWSDIPRELAELRGVELTATDWDAGVDRLVKGLDNLATRVRPRIIDPEDPQKGRWGGRSKRGVWDLTGVVSELTSDWFSVELTVRSTASPPPVGTVEFHLHDSFNPDVERVPLRFGAAGLKLNAYGAFTVGALLDDGTTLELDLTTLASAPAVFLER
jgi:hypothetical protein